MTAQSLKTCVKRLKGLFPTASPEQCDLMAAKFNGYPEKVVLAALADHAALHTELSIPGLIEGLRAKSLALSAATSTHRRLCDELRYYARTQWGISKYEHLSDAEVIVTHHSDSWAGVRDNPALEQTGKQTARKIIQEGCRRGMVELGYPEDEAVEIARDTVELEPGERVRLADVLRQSL